MHFEGGVKAKCIVACYHGKNPTVVNHKSEHVSKYEQFFFERYRRLAI